MADAETRLTTPTPQEQVLGIVNNDVLAERTKTQAGSLFRMLRALESAGIIATPSPLSIVVGTPR